jgi:glyoxylase I family protein
MNIKKVHHIAIIASDYEVSKAFYTKIMGLEILAEHYREERQSYKLDLALNGEYLIELFSFPDPPARPSHPEARGLRHLAFAVSNVEHEIAKLKRQNVKTTDIMTDEFTGKKMAFFFDPDELPLELYEV